jgi:hypothetical protein
MYLPPEVVATGEPVVDAALEVDEIIKTPSLPFPAL